MRKKETE